MKKYVITFILGMIVATTITVSATILYQANEIGFTPEDNNWNVNNLESALNDLYNNRGGSFTPTKEGFVFDGWYTSMIGGTKININSNIPNVVYPRWKWINDCSETNQTITLSYTGDVQPLNLNCSGTYKLEVWGAQGGDNTCIPLDGGKGGYASGYKTFTANTSLYVYVGGKGNTMNGTGDYYGGYNGGGGIRCSSIESTCDNRNGTGGGATDISTVYSDMTKNSSTLRYERTEDSYNSRIIVAGGGGGSGDLYHRKSVTGGFGGGLTGGGDRPGSQTGTSPLAPETRVAAPAKGLGGSGNGYKNVSTIVGGGAGYYGGDYSRAYSNAANTKSSGGGSSYINGLETYNNDSPQTISGDSQMPNPTGGTETGHSGNGYARITYLGN